MGTLPGGPQARKAVKRLLDRRELGRLRASDDRNGAILADIYAAPPDAVPPWSNRIEQLRREMMADYSVIEDAWEQTPDNPLTVSAACGVSKSVRDCRFMASLIAAYKPLVVLELGTNVGVSSAYIAKALEPHGGIVHTLEGQAGRQNTAKKLHAALGIQNVGYTLGYFQDTLSGVLADLDVVPFAFIDGNHQYEPTLEYFHTIAGRAAQGAVFVFDDITWSDGMRRAWDEISDDPKVTVSVGNERMGVCVLSTGASAKWKFQILPVAAVKSRYTSGAGRGGHRRPRSAPPSTTPTHGGS